MREERREFLKGIASVPVFVAIISLAITAMLWIAAFRYVQERDEARFGNAVEYIRGIVGERLDRQIALLDSTKAMMILTPDISRDQFRDYVKVLDIDTNYPGATGLGWSELLKPADVPHFLERVKAHPHRTPTTAAGQIHAIFALEPEKNASQTATGINMFVESNRRSAMIRARDTGEPVMTDRVVPLNTPGDIPAFIIYDPVYRTHGTPPPADRARLLRGFVYSPFRAQKLLENVFPKVEQADVRVSVYSGALPKPDKLLYTFGSKKPRLDAVMHDSRPVTKAGQTWTLVYESTPTFETASGRGLLIWIPVAGILIASLLTSLTWRQARAAQEISDQADELSRRVLHQQLLAEAGQLVNEHLDYQRTLAGLSTVAVPSFADYCTVDMPNDAGEIRRISVTHRDRARAADLMELDRRFPEPIDGHSPFAQVLRDGKPILIKDIDDNYLGDRSYSAEHLKAVKAINAVSAIVVPMSARGKTLGTLTFVTTDSGRHYDQDDLKVAAELGARAGMAIDNSLLYHEAQTERAEVGRLYEQMESLVQERTMELERSNRELEAFSYSVSHDLRGPLRSVDGFSRALLDDYGDMLDDTAKGYVGRVRTAARRMDELITSLLKLSRITRSSITRETTDVTQIASEVSDEARAIADKPVEIDVQPGMTANADGKMLHVVLLNLIGNAVKFSSTSESPKVMVGQKGNVFFVRDNGVGFNPEYSSKLFAPFERLHSNDQFSGSGIGLATVERIVKRHGGRIWAESKEGHGATFFFTVE